MRTIIEEDGFGRDLEALFGSDGAEALREAINQVLPYRPDVGILRGVRMRRWQVSSPTGSDAFVVIIYWFDDEQITLDSVRLNPIV